MDNEKTLVFPCEFPIKIMGLANDDFEVSVLQTVHHHFPDMGETSIKMKHSKNKKYLSLTVTVIAKNQQQLDDLYQDLTKNPQVIFAL